MHNKSSGLVKGNITRLALGVIVFSLVLVGCGKHGGKKEATQVAAKVNGTEISVHQINQVLSHTEGVTQGNIAQVRKEVLEKLISQQIAVDRAVESRLDRSPETIMAIESARRDVLARAYLMQLGNAAAKVSDGEIKKYFDEHPDLFSNRRIYTFQDISLRRDDGLMRPLRDMVSHGKPMQEIASWLKNNEVKFGANADTRSAEQIPFELLPRIAQIKDGQTSLIEMGKMLHIFHLVSYQQSPFDLAAATPRISQFLSNQHGQEAITKEMKKLRGTAKVEYLGEFTKVSEGQSVEDVGAQKNMAPNASIAKGAAGL